MSRKQRKAYSAEFKLEAAQWVTERGYRIIEAARAMGVSKSAMGSWVRQLRGELQGKTPKVSPITPEQQRIKELERKIKWIEEENTILKKATALLVSNSLNSFH